MIKLFTVLLVIFTCLSTVDAKERNIVGYLPTWKNWEVKDIDGDILTTIKLAFLVIKKQKVAFTSKYNEQQFINSIEKLNQLRSKYPHLKLVVSVGGWGINGFSEVASSFNKRKLFARSIAVFLNTYNLDGVDIDWEFPTRVTSNTKARVDDKINLVLLIEEIKNELDKLQQSNKKSYSISVAVGVGSWVLNSIDFKAMELNVTYFGLMTYNFYGPWSEKTGHNSPLYNGDNTWSINNVINLILGTGVDKSQLVVGIALYGRQMNNVESNNNGLLQKFQGNGGINSITYGNIKDFYLNDINYERFFDKKSKVPYLYNEKEKIFVTYNDEESIEYLLIYLKENQLDGGVMVWEITQDDKERSLIKAINRYYD